jgi:hypothetical protein
MRLLVAMVLSLLVMGCTGESGDNQSNRQQTASDDRPPQPAPAPPSSESREMIPDVDIVPEGVSLLPFFDAEGTITERTASVGDQVDIYVFVETPEPIKVSAAAYRLDIPAGVDYFREAKFPQGTMSMGTWDTNYSMAWPCRDVGRYWVMHYEFLVSDGFTGGEFATVDGFEENSTMFIGFGTCHGNLGDTMRAAPGSVTLTLK